MLTYDEKVWRDLRRESYNVPFIAQQRNDKYEYHLRKLKSIIEYDKAGLSLHPYDNGDMGPSNPLWKRYYWEECMRLGIAECST